MTMVRVVRLGLVLCFAALVPSLFVLLAGQNPWRVLTTLLLYALGPQGWSEVLVHAIPLTLIGLGVAFALRAGLFNIGGDGQLIAGAVLSVFFAPYFAGWGIAGTRCFPYVWLRRRRRAWGFCRILARALQRQRDHRHDHVELCGGANGELSYSRTDGRPGAVLSAVLRHPAGCRPAGYRAGNAASRRTDRRSHHGGSVCCRAAANRTRFPVLSCRHEPGGRDLCRFPGEGAHHYRDGDFRRTGGARRRGRGRRHLSADRRQYGGGARIGGHCRCVDRPP